MTAHTYIFYEEPGIQLYCGDCADIMPSLPPVDLIVTDPPYGMGRVANDGKDYLDVVGPRLRMAWATLKTPGSMFIFCSTGEVLRVGAAVGQPLKRMLWMYKPADGTFPLGGWLLTSDAILWFAKGVKLNLAERHPYQADCYVVNKMVEEKWRGHPTVKPLWVIRDIVSRCPKGGTVLDPFVGSGTTLRAAKDLGIKAIGIELEQKYCELAVRRLRQQVLFPGGG